MLLQCNYTINQLFSKIVCSYERCGYTRTPVVFRSSFARSSRTSPICQGFRNFLSLIESSTYLIKYGYNLSKLEIGFSLWEFIEFRKSLKSVENCIVDYQSVTCHKIAMSEEESLLRGYLESSTLGVSLFALPSKTEVKLTLIHECISLYK